MTNDIAKASSSIRMESYIFAADVVGRQIATALASQARRGRRVELRVDYAGSRWELGGALVRELCEAGVLFEWSRRWQWLRPWEFHRRNHRKLLIIDDAIAYTGGFNVHVPSSLRLAGQNRWRDTHVRFDGPAVRQAIDVFEGSGREAQELCRTSNSFRLMPNATRRCRWRLRCELDRVLRAAERRIWLTTPYFLPDRRLRRRLVRAARRGVDVRVLMPAKSDVPISQWAAHALYRGMLRNGVRLYEYQPRVLHAKTLLVDDAWATIGTANFDYRSLFVNAEVNLIARDERFCETLARQFGTDIEASHEITAELWQRRSWWRGVREKLAWRLRRWL
jgi:cardiolipin synthase